MNSAIQGISACGVFVREIDSLYHQYEHNKVDKLLVFKELMDILNNRQVGRLDISQNLTFRSWNQPGQQDSYELLAYILTDVYNQLRKLKEIRKSDLDGWLREKLPMRLIIQHTFVCGCHLKTNSPLQTDFALHVTIPKSCERNELKMLVEQYFRVEMMEEYSCYVPGCDGTGTRRFVSLMEPLPGTICIHLQRMFWNGYGMEKINNKVSFEATLTIKYEYCHVTSSFNDTIEIRKNGNYINCEPSVVVLRTDTSDTPDGNAAPGARKTPKISESAKIGCSDKIIEAGVLVEAGEGNCNENTKDRDDSGIEEDGRTNKKAIRDKTSFSAEERKACDVKEAKYIHDISEKKTKSVDIIVEGCESSYKEDPCEGLTTDKENRDQKYELVSVINHSGTVGGGHYVCYKRVCGQWFLTDDSCVRQVPESEVLKSQAYILFYEKLSQD